MLFGHRATATRMLDRVIPLAAVLLLSSPSLAPAQEAALVKSASGSTVKEIFDTDQTNQTVMQIEAAMARAQAAHGVIPHAAADEITRKADIRFAPAEDIKAERKIVQHRMVALLNVWRKSLDENARQYLHFGATTVDIYDTAQTLQLRRSTLLIIGYLRDVEDSLIKLARDNQDAVMAGRTLGQHALPITFGKKVSTWIGSNRRNIERLKVVLRELDQSAILKGAVGTYGGLGEKAIEVEQSFAKELGLQKPYADDWHGSRDVYASYALTLALISRSFAHIGQELFLLQTTDIAETAEPRDAASVSSSSMAQKINPSKSETLIQAGRTIPRLAEVVLDDVVNFFERDNTSGPNATLEEISIATEKNLLAARDLLSEVRVDRDQMRANLQRTKGFILAQRVVFALSDKLGKHEADEKVRGIIHKAMEEGSDFRTSLLADPEIAKLLTPDVIDTLLEPQGYVGLSLQEVDAVISSAQNLRQTDP